MEKYGLDADSGLDLRQHTEEFQDWTMVVPFANGEAVTILCCPEDLRCEQIECENHSRMCADCRLPVCSECEKYLSKRFTIPDPSAELPPAALANEMLMFYGPDALHRKLDDVAGMSIVE